MPRKVPFSGKKKKEQLQAKKHRHNPDGDELGQRERSSSNTNRLPTKSADNEGSHSKFFDTIAAPSSSGGAGAGGAGRYALKFRQESQAIIQAKREEARKTIVPIDSPQYLECSLEDFFNSDLDFPIRPPWDFSMSKAEVERSENSYFMNYLKEIELKFDTNELSYFELNLETWRQFWRVLEMADILLCVVDIRFPPLLFPPKLYTYCKETLGKPVILILNKIDLAPPELVLAWEDYFQHKFPDLEVVKFTSFPSGKTDDVLEPKKNKGKSMKFNRRKGKFRMAAEAGMDLYKTCEKIVKGEVDISSWKAKIQEELESVDEEDEEESTKIGSIEAVPKPDTGFYEYKNKYSDGILTIGCIGQPNVGKSSVINAIMGKKVVSVSRTPGHTKHFQTIFLTPNVKLCDCPGLIFPSKVPKELQVLCGSYPIAQLREPFSTVKYLAERIDLVQLLRIQHPEGKDEEWSAYDICDGWALKRGYYTAKASRLDSYRGANHLLRLALDGRICLNLRPIDFTTKEENFKSDPRLCTIKTLQGIPNEPDPSGRDLDLDNLSSEDERDRRSDNDSSEEESERPPPITKANKFSLLSEDAD